VRRRLLLGIVVAAATFLLATAGGDLAGTDGQAVAEIEERSPTDDRWATPVWAPDPTGEALLFALQGGVGAVLLGQYLDRLRTSEGDAPDA